MTELIPVDSVQPTAMLVPASVHSRFIQTARPRFSDEYVYINREQSLLRMARYMQPDATYRRAVPEDGTPSFHSQMWLVAKT